MDPNASLSGSAPTPPQLALHVAVCTSITGMGEGVCSGPMPMFAIATTPVMSTPLWYEYVTCVVEMLANAVSGTAPWTMRSPDEPVSNRTSSELEPTSTGSVAQPIIPILARVAR